MFMIVAGTVLRTGGDMVDDACGETNREKN